MRARLGTRIAILTVGLLTVHSHAWAQGPSLSNMISSLLFNEVILVPGTPEQGGSGPSHIAHFNILNDPQGFSADATQALALGTAFSSTLSSQISTFPIGTSAAGFIWDTVEGSFLPSRATESFGPSFAERARTIGRGRFGVGFTYQHTKFDSFEGQSLDGGDLVFFLPHVDCCPAGGNGSLLGAAFEGDVIETRLLLQAETDTYAFFANYGVASNWDVGVAIPIVQVDLTAATLNRVLRFSTPGNTNIHSFEEGPNAVVPLTASGTASGLGDILVRTKYNFFRGERASLAVGVDLRLPTGNADDLLGIDATQGKFSIIASTGTGRFAQHFNLGYVVSEKQTSERYLPVELGPNDALARPEANALLEQSAQSLQATFDEVTYGGGVEIVATPRVTVLADVVGRTLKDALRLETQARTFIVNRCLEPTDCIAANPDGPFAISQYPEGGDLLTPQLTAGNLNLLLGTVGAKVELGSNLLFAGSVVFPLNDAGLRSKYTIATGIEYSR